MPVQYCPAGFVDTAENSNIFEGQWRQNISNTDGLQNLKALAKKNSISLAKLVQQYLSNKI